MSNNLSLRSIDIPQLHRFGVGFDRMFDRVDEILRINAQHNVNYPPINISKTSDGKTFIEVAIAGFSGNEIKVEVTDRVMTIHGEKLNTDNDVEYVHRGISFREFNRQFILAEYVEVLSATVKDGILKIVLEQQIPESKKPKLIKLEYMD